MGKTVPDWQTFLRCTGGNLVIRHLKDGLAEDLEVPWPKSLRNVKCEKVRFRAEDLRPLAQYEKTLDTVELKDCTLEPGALAVLSGAASLRCLSLENCGISDEDLGWFRGTPKLELLVLTGNPKCTGAVAARAVGSPLRGLHLQGTDFRDADLPLLLSFPLLETLNVSDTKVTGAALPQLAENRALDVTCDHAREGVARFRAAQRNHWKKNLSLDAEPAEGAMQFVRDFYEISRDGRQRRSHLVTQRYLDDCRARGCNGVDPGQKVSLSCPSAPPYQDCRVVDVEQVTKKKFYVYGERDDASLSQYRYLVLRTEAGWQIDRSERLLGGKWQFWRLD